jgi:membrane protease YdiL (CAAX protease family)
VKGTTAVARLLAAPLDDEPYTEEERAEDARALAAIEHGPSVDWQEAQVWPLSRDRGAPSRPVPQATWTTVAIHMLGYRRSRIGDVIGGLSFMALARRWPLLTYFALAYLLSGVALIVVGLPNLHPGTVRSWAPLALFPVMVVGVGGVGIALTAVLAGKSGLAELRSRIKWPTRRRWLLILLLPPVAIVAVLSGLKALVSPNFAPQFLVFGVAAGVIAGFFEEFGWTGFAYPRMRSRFGALAGALLLGLLWGVWHLPVVDSLGAASPHGPAWFAFFGSFVAMVIPLRVLIAWAYNNTGSLLLAQLLHASSSGFLVILGAPHVAPAQEAAWYSAYAGVLWLVVVGAIAMQGVALGDRPAAAPPSSQVLPPAAIP